MNTTDDSLRVKERQVNYIQQLTQLYNQDAIDADSKKELKLKIASAIKEL